jgi:sulfur carrier protein
VRILLNGRPSELSAGETVARVLALLGLTHDARGVAVAVDGEVVPRSSWESFALPEGARVEVLTAMQGG